MGCGQTEPCSTHQRSAPMRHRPERAALYRTERWRQLSRAFLRCHPICGMRGRGAPETRDSQCQLDQRTTAATSTDHIVPHHGPADPNAWCPSNLQALCHACHGRKSNRDRAYRGRVCRNHGEKPPPDLQAAPARMKGNLGFMDLGSE